MAGKQASGREKKKLIYLAFARTKTTTTTTTFRKRARKRAKNTIQSQCLRAAGIRGRNQKSMRHVSASAIGDEEQEKLASEKEKERKREKERSSERACGSSCKPVF